MLPGTISYKPFLIAWNLTRQCNLRCGHCYMNAVWLGGSDNLLTLEEGFRLIDDIASVNLDTILVLTGGEPLLYKHTLDYAGYASKKGLMVVIGTNGILLDDRMVRRLMDSGVSGVGISLDSIDPSIHDTFRGYPGAWRQAVEAIERCRRHGLPFQVHHSVMSFNWADVWEMVEFAHYKGARVVNFFFMVCTGRGEKLTDITPEQYEEVLSALIDLQAKYPGMMIRARCAPHFKRIAYQKDPHSPITKAEGYLGGGCLAGSHHCRIAPDGEITPCPYMPLSVGNVRRDRFPEIWENAAVFRELRAPQLKGKGGECEYEELCGGCRARPYADHGDYLDEDLWCQYKPEGGEKIGVSEMSEEMSLVWTKEAEERLNRLPFFLRSMIKGNVGKYAKEHGITSITPELLDELRRRRMGESQLNSNSANSKERHTELSEVSHGLSEVRSQKLEAGREKQESRMGDESGEGIEWTEEALREIENRYSGKPMFAKIFMSGIIKEDIEMFARSKGITRIDGEALRAAGEEGKVNVEWSPEAWERLQKAPDFIRSGIRKAAGKRAMRMGVPAITAELLTQFRNMAMMKAVKRIKALGYHELTFDAFDFAKENFKNIRDNNEARERLDEIKEYVTSKGNVGLIDEEMLNKMKDFLRE